MSAANNTSLSGSPDDLIKLKQSGIHTLAQLLERGSTSIGRMRIADETQLTDAIIKDLVHLADLMRIANMKREHAMALLSVGVTTAPKLAFHEFNALYIRLQSLGHMIPHDTLRQYARSARQIPKIVQH